MNIRKVFCVILTIALIGMLSACGPRGETVPQGESQMESEIIQIEPIEFLKSYKITSPRASSPYGTDYRPETDYHFMERGASFLSLTSSQEEYYYICMTQKGNYLYYLPKDTMQAIALCNKPNCMHEKRENPSEGSQQEQMQKKLECNAFINDVRCIAYSNGAVYALGNLDPLGQNQALYQISLDGAKKEIVHEFRFDENYDENGNWKGEDHTYLLDDFQIHRGNLYYIVVDQEKAVLCRNKLGQFDQKPESVFEYAKVGSYSHYILYGDYLFLRNNATRVGDNLRIHLDTLEKKEINVDYINTIFEGKLLCTGTDGLVILRDLDGKEIQRIPGGPAATARGGYIITFDIDQFTKEAPVLTFNLYDGKGEAAGQIEITGTSYPDIVAGDGDRIFFGVYSDDLEYGYLDLTKEAPEFHSFYKFIETQ